MAHRLFENWTIITATLVFLATNPLCWLDCLPQSVLAQSPNVYDLGKKTYQAACLSCHGKNGDARTPFAQALEPKPRDFTKGVFKFRSTFPGVLPTDEDLKKTIKRGIAGTSMPAWKNILSEAEIDAVIQYLKSFFPFFAQWASSDTLTPSAPPILSPEGISRGREIYKIMGCWSCHGLQGRGDGPSAKGLLDEEKRPIKAYDFTTGNLKGGSEMADIYRTLMTGLRGTPMPSFFWAFGFAREDLEELLNKEVYQHYFSGAEVNNLKKFIEKIPTKAELDTMDSTQLNQVTKQRKWDLVQYVYSLKRKPGLFSELFIRDHELTR